MLQRRMIPIGYMYKTVALRPSWLRSEGVVDIFSLSDCISTSFANYIQFWEHNGFWLFDSPEKIKILAARERIDLSTASLFYYEALDGEFDELNATWRPFAPEASAVTDVQIPHDKHLLGFDVVSFSRGNEPECSPLSCNGLAAELPTNQHCLFDSYDDAMRALERGDFKKMEPGPFRVIAVYAVGSHSLGA